VEGGLNEVTVRVHNEGKAIAPAMMQTLFNAVKHQALRPTHDQQGPVRHLGLGLYITNEIVKAHGGKISVILTEEGGTSFTIHLPRSLN
ncbi:MAG TPA: ATP-binding protein, partial [Noviherbaspirillum sp.]